MYQLDKKKFRKFILITASLILQSLLNYSCSDELGFPSDSKITEDNTLYLLLPNIEKAKEFGKRSRANNQGDEKEVEALAEEGKVKSLWFCAFPVGSDASPVITNLESQNSQVSTTSDYTSYKVEMEYGKYKIFILANLDDLLCNEEGALINIEDLHSADEISKLRLDYSKLKEQKLNAGGLPMVCFNDEIEDGNHNTLTNGELDFKPGNTEIYAKMHFLCSKIRYTILFDSTDSEAPEGFSKIFGDKLIDFDEEVIAQNIGKITHLVTPGTNDLLEIEWTQELEKREYPENGSQYLNNEEDLSENLTILEGEDPEWDDNKKRAWQSVAYMPERIADSNATKFKFKGRIGVDPAADSAEEKIYVLDVFNKENGSNGLERGKFYDVKILMEKSGLQYEIKVHEWDMENLQYSLHGPYDLIVDNTSIKVTAGEYSHLHYETESGIKPMVKSPLYYPEGETEGIPFYLFTVDEDENGNYEKGLITIGINPEIPVSFNPEGKDMDQFHINLGNLYKKIEVSPLEFGPFLNVSPELISIDLLQSISSQQYSGFFNIHYNTNVEGLTVKVEESNGNSGTLSSSAYPLDGDFSVGSLLFLTGLPDNHNNGDIKLNYNNLASGKNFWKTKHTYVLTFEVDADYILEEGKQVPPVKQVKIEVNPLVTDYIIHFRPVDDSWQNPHIYVFQPLTLPSDLNGVYAERAGKTVGYHDNNQTFTAVEFDFTFGIAFKGWFGYGGPACNDPKANGHSEGKYFFFDGQDASFIADNDHRADSDKRYFREVHSNYNHQHKLGDSYVCGECFALNQDAGIVMQEEYIDGKRWWTYTLSGVATPGKALIRFNEGHAYNDGMAYPKKGERGIPLFDFPDNEGWFIYNPGLADSQFEDEMPAIKEIKKTYRIYWPQIYGKKIHLWIANGSGVIWNSESAGFETDAHMGEYGKYYYYMDFETVEDGDMYFNYPIYNETHDYVDFKACNNLAAFQLSDSFTKDNVDYLVYSGYMPADVTPESGDKQPRIIGGKPDIAQDPNAFELGIVLHLYWGYASSGDRISISSNGDTLVSSEAGIQDGIDYNVFYYDFKIDRNISSLDIELEKANGDKINRTIKPNDIGTNPWEGEPGVKYYAIGL